MSREERHQILAIVGIGCDVVAILFGIAMYIFTAGVINGLWPKISDIPMLILILMSMFALYGGIFEIVALIRRDVSVKIRVLGGILLAIVIFFFIKIHLVFGVLA